MNKTTRYTLSKIIAPIFIGLVILGGLFVIFREFDQVVDALRIAQWQPLIGAILFTIIAYTSMSLSFAAVCRLFRIKMSVPYLALIGYVTNTLNRIVTGGGIAGLSLRLIIMSREGIALRDSIAASMMHYYLGTIDMMVMLPIGILYFVNNTNVSQGMETFLKVFTVVLISLVVIATLIIFNPQIRHWILNIAYQISNKFSKKDYKSTLRQFEKTLSRGILFMRYRPLRLISAIIFTWCEWFASVFTLGYCLEAFGTKPSFGVVMTGYVIGITLGLASMVPGGLGVQEGAMTFVFTLLGVPLGQAVLATILFRAVYYFFPYLVSLVFYRPLLNTTDSISNS